MLNLNSLYNGDCLEVMNQIDDKSIDLICTDLPYGQTARNKWDTVIPFCDYVKIKGNTYYENDVFKISGVLNKNMEYTKKWFDENKKTGLWTHYKRIIKDNGAIVLFANGMFTADLMKSNEKMWRYNLVWQKTQPTGHLNAKRMPLRSHEDICVFYKKLPTYNPQKTTGHKRKISTAKNKMNCKKTLNYGEYNLTSYDSTERYPTSVWTFSKDIQKSAIHPTQKPVALIEKIIKTYSNENEIVLDSCAGSMTTAIACINTHRQYICIEKDKDIFESGKERVQKAKK
mgnify:FL=1